VTAAPDEVPPALIDQ